MWCYSFRLRGYSPSKRLYFLTKYRTETRNVVNDENGDYENVIEYIPIAQPNAATITKIDALAPSTVFGDRMANSYNLA